MSTRASTARHVRQRKLNTKQQLRIIRESEIEETLDDEAQRQIHQVETGVEKGEEVEFHLQAVISAHNAAALGAEAKQSYIPTPDAVRAKDVDYDALYPKAFRQPATYIRFSSTVEDCNGVAYCLNEDDAAFLAQLNEGRVDVPSAKEKPDQCSQDTLEEILNFFEESSERLQPMQFVDNAPMPSLEEMEQTREEPLSSGAQKFLQPVYAYWIGKRGNRPLLPTIKVRVLDTTSEADDADPYICFRRREVRQTRKTRGRDAQVVEKLKKLRVELEQARNLVHMVRQREDLSKTSLEINRKVFDERRKLKEVKVSKGIKGESGEDELLLVNQKPVAKPKTKQDAPQPRPPTIRLRSGSERPAPDDSLPSLADQLAEAEAFVNRTIESRKEQHRRWNHHWHDRTWNPITPPPEPDDEMLKWAPLLPQSHGYPTPPPSAPSGSPVDRDGDIDMVERKPMLQDLNSNVHGSSQIFLVKEPPGMSQQSMCAYMECEDTIAARTKQRNNPNCRLRYGRGGRRYLEVQRPKIRGTVRGGVVSDSDSDEEMVDYNPVPAYKIFEYRVMMNRGSGANWSQRPESAADNRRQWSSGDQSVVAAGTQNPPQQATAGSTS